MSVDISSATRVPSRPHLARRTIGLLLVSIGVIGLTPVTLARADSPVASGYRLVSSEALAPGVQHQTLQQDQPSQTVHVARLAAGMARQLLPVLARDVLTGPSSGVEPTIFRVRRRATAGARARP